MTLIYLVVGWVVGILAAASLRLPTLVWLAFLLVPLGYLALFWRDPHLRKWHFVLVLFVLGGLRYQLAQPDTLSLELQQFNEQGRASLIGVVETDPDVRQTQTQVLVRVGKIQSNGEWRDVHGLALVSVPRDTLVNYGDEVQVDGAPETPLDGADFSYRDYLAREHVFTLVRTTRLFVITSGKGNAIWATLYGINHAAQAAVNQLLPEPSAALLNGILLGNDRGLPSDLKQAFANTNTAHLVAISGFNIAVLIGVLAFALRKPNWGLHPGVSVTAQNPLPRRFATFRQHFVTLLILVVLILYTFLVGASASVVRACIMGALSLLAFSFGRQSWALTALGASAFVMSLLNPYVLWDVGFQLSFLATLGLLLYIPHMEGWLERQLKQRVSGSRSVHLLAFFKDGVLVTLAAFIVTAPLLILYFHRVSLVGFLTNFLVLPVQPAIMVLGGAATLFQLAANALSAVPIIPLLLGGLAQGLAWGAYVCLQYTILVVQATAAIPYGSFETPRVDAPLVVLFYAGLFGVTALGVRRTATLLLTRVWVPITLLALAVIFVSTSALAAPDPRTRVIFVGADRGDATFIRTAQDYRILINGTDEPGTLLSFIGAQLPPWDRRIDLVIATHVGEQNLASITALTERYEVGQVVEPSAAFDQRFSLYTQRHKDMEQRQIRVLEAEYGLTLQAGEARLQVMNDDPAALVLYLQIEDRTFLLVAPMGQSRREQAVKKGALVPADVAVFPPEFEEEWVEKVNPATVIFFVDKNPRETPSAETLKLLEGRAVLRTDERGTLTFVLEEGHIQMQTAR